MTVSQPISRLVAVLTGPLTTAEFAARIEALESEHGPDLAVASVTGRFEVRTPGRICGCSSCLDADAAVIKAAGGPWWVGMTRGMVVCPDCGNKRCPKAAHHDHTCTGSNEPGQPGSNYPALPGAED